MGTGYTFGTILGTGMGYYTFWGYILFLGGQVLDKAFGWGAGYFIRQLGNNGDIRFNLIN